MRTYPFENLGVWQKSRVLVGKIYKISAKFPNEEKFGLTSQIRRAGVSVCSNLAEGSGRISGKEQARFTEIAYSSLLEVLNQLFIAADLHYMKMEELNELRPLFGQLTLGLNNLRKAQLKK